MGASAQMMAPRYSLRDLYRPYGEIEIDEEDADRIKKSYQFLVACNKTEDLFSLIAISYREFESFVFQSGLTEHIDGFGTIGEPIELKYGKLKDEANQKLLSLANAYRALCDQSPQRLLDAEALLPDIRKRFTAFLSEAFDSSFEYRIFDFLRNMITHHDMPVTSATILSARLSKDETAIEQSPVINRTSLELSVSKSAIVASPKGRKLTKKEVTLLTTEEIDLKFIVRGFIAALFEARDKFHKYVDEAHQEATYHFDKAYQEFKTISRYEAKFLELQKSEDNDDVQLCPIKQTLPQLIETRQRLAKGLIGASKSYPSVELARQRKVYAGADSSIWLR